MNQAQKNHSTFNESHNFAILIDADNISAKHIESILSEVAKYGVASIKRIYGDWTKSNNNQWKDSLLSHAIQPMQQFAYTTGKNATDSAMIIDAMDLLYTQPYLYGFCLISSDSDFTRLASRLREAGKVVYGFGEEKTPKAFRSTCDQFIYVENLIDPSDSVAEDTQTHQINTIAINEITTINKEEQKTNTIDAQLITLINDAISAASGDGQARLSDIGSYIQRVQNDFDSRTYGYTKLIDLIRATSEFEISGNNNQITIKAKDKKITQKKLSSLTLAAFKDCAEDGKAPLSAMIKRIKEIQPNFDYQNYGYSKASTFIKAINEFSVDTTINPTIVSLKKPPAK